jgi:hypothetical protein
VKFAGHIIDADGIRADPDKIQAIKDMHPPSNVFHRTFSVFRTAPKPNDDESADTIVSLLGS